MDGERVTDNRHYKERVRAQIELQVQEYLRRGGRIDVLSARSHAGCRVMGDVWHGPLDIPLLEK